MSKIIDRQILKNFKGKGYFNRNVLYSFLTELDPDVTESALVWRTNDLMKRKVIDQVKMGVYAVSDKDEYLPDISKKLVKLSRIVTNEFEGLDYCLWSSEWLNDFVRHQLGVFFYILEVENDLLEEVFNAYSEYDHLRVYLNPNEDIMSRYIKSEQTLIIKPLISRSPKRKLLVNENYRKKIYVPAIEKILVDVFSDPVTFYAVQGSEMETLFENAMKHYAINFTKLISYAKRRNKEMLIKTYLKEHFGDFVKDILE